MDKSFVENVTKFLKQQGIFGLMVLLLVYGYGTFNTQLANIQKEIVEVKITLAKMQEKYAEKEAVRDMITTAVEKLEQKYHTNNNSN